MIIFKKAAALQHHLQRLRAAGNTIGFVPTMGALHPGHLSLVHQSKKEAACTVCSIFVNPTQFNNPSDFEHYPVTLERDVELLLGAGCDVLFLPPAAEVYPAGHVKKQYDLGPLENILEGAFRPGHFQGVCEVVDRLLQLVQPQVLYMGAKDYQQCLVVQRLLALTGRTGVRLHVGPTLREADGLAMSSRNLRLGAAERQKATALHRELQALKQAVRTAPPQEAEQTATQALEAAGFGVDYVAVRHAQTLQPLQNGAAPRVALVAATLNGVRLIDNLPID